MYISLHNCFHFYSLIKTKTLKPLSFLTMSTSFLLKPNFTLNPLTNQYPLIQLSPIKPCVKSPSYPSLIKNPVLTLKYSVTSENILVLDLVSKETGRDSYDNLDSPIQSSVLKLQIGVLGSAKSLQREFNRIAEIADTSTVAGLTRILTETTRAVIQHADYCISGYSSVDVKSNMEDAEKIFTRLSIEECEKLDEETLVNVDNKKVQRKSNKALTGFENEYIVITIIVAAEGVLKLPTIGSSEDLQKALQIIGSINTDQTLAVEVVWTPQDENEVLTAREVQQKYPLLRPLSDTNWDQDPLPST